MQVLAVDGRMTMGNGWVSPSHRAAAGSSAVTPLVGQALLDKARALSDRPEDQIARACGYVGPSGRILRKSFYRALVEAKGYALPAAAAASASRGDGSAKGRQADFRTRVHGNGNLLIGPAYTRRMGLEPGDEFRIELHRETGSIWLLPIEEAGSAVAEGRPDEVGTAGDA